MKRHRFLNMTARKAMCLFLCISMCMNTALAADLETDPYPLFYLQRNLTNILVNDNFSPPVAARNYVYPQLAANFVLSQGKAGAKIFDAIGHFPAIRTSLQPGNYSASLAASYAFYRVAEQLVYTPQPLADSFTVLLDWYRKKGINAEGFQSAKLVGNEVAEQVIAWMNQDGFNETRTRNKYVLLKAPGKWQLTPPGYFGAVEPHWGMIRTMLPGDKAGLDSLLPVSFDTATASVFFREATYVYNVSKKLTAPQKQIASFWDCNPFALRPVGHINAIVKKISPGGHWMNITGIAAKQKGLGLYETSRAFTCCAIGLFDAFIYTWQKKYQYNYLRPETFISQTGIDDNWRPYIQSPPFPEFPSGHAVVSNTAAAILTALFGEHFAYTDDSEAGFGIASRRFNSFQQAADEATMSRVYGGIHFLFSCNTGKAMGKEIGSQVVKKIKLKSNQ